MRALQLDPARTGVVVFDMLEADRSAIDGAGTDLPVQRLLAGARAAGVAVFWAHGGRRPDGADFAKTLTDTNQKLRPWMANRRPSTRPLRGSGSPGLRVLAEPRQRPHDDGPKHRWSAFCGTHLDLSLRSAGIDTVLLVGGSTHVGIASTAYAACDMGFQVVIVRDGCRGFAEQRAFFLDKVFPRMCRIRTVDDVLSALLEGNP